MATLREGYSTGACAAAVCATAWRRLNGQRLTEIGVLFPDGATRLLPLCEAEAPASAVLIKDGGDDPDCTHGAAIYARARELCPDAEAEPADYLLAVGEARVILRAVEGIGLCTRPGLDCEPGKWAINVTPRRMIAENLRLAGLRSGTWLFELGVEGGAELAVKTLNARLGVVGGLSILGTTGIVRPYSHEAYIATIRLCVGALRDEGVREVVFCTGGRTRTGAMGRLSGPPEAAFVFIGDFIAESLAAARACGMASVTVACMPGKLCKYAAGFENTHAHRVGQDMALFCREAEGLAKRFADGPNGSGGSGVDADLITKLEACASVREALLILPERLRLPLLRRLAALALRCFAAHWGDAPGQGGNVPPFRILLFDFQGHFLLEAV